MTIETYFNFLKIVECGNISAASQKLMIAQPALSNQLKNLEKSVGAKLVNRNARGISLTPAGEIFYKKAQIICNVDTSMMKEIHDYVDGIAGTLKISLPPSNPMSLMMTLFDDYVQSHPDVNYEIKEVLSSIVAENVRNNISEIGMIRSKISNSEDFHILPYSSEEMMVLLSSSHPLAKYSSLMLEQITDEPIATTEAVIPAITQAFESVGATAQFMIKTSIRRTAILWADRYKNCIAILPCSDEELDIVASGHYKILKISDYDFSTKRDFIIMRNRRLSPIAKDFLQSLGMKLDFTDV
jgi:DNA-binding transcriptional LysR family regulator